MRPMSAVMKQEGCDCRTLPSASSDHASGRNRWIQSNVITTLMESASRLLFYLRDSLRSSRDGNVSVGRYHYRLSACRELKS